MTSAPIANCELDDDAALAFLARAVPVIIGANILPPTLGLLDSLAASPNAYGLGSRPELAALAAEWSAPYASPGVGAERSPVTLRECVLALLETDADGKVEAAFRTYAVDETENWTLPKSHALHGLPVFGLYAFREGERTYCCSTSPDSWCIALENVFLYPDQDDYEGKRDAYGQTPIEQALDDGITSEGLDDSYFSFLGDRAALDKREAEVGDVSAREVFEANILRVDLSKLDGFASSPANFHADNALADAKTCSAAFHKAAMQETWEDAREYFSGNSVHPRILFSTPVPVAA